MIKCEIKKLMIRCGKVVNGYKGLLTPKEINNSCLQLNIIVINVLPFLYAIFDVKRSHFQ